MPKIASNYHLFGYIMARKGPLLWLDRFRDKILALPQGRYHTKLENLRLIVDISLPTIWARLDRNNRKKFRGELKKRGTRNQLYETHKKLEQISQLLGRCSIYAKGCVGAISQFSIPIGRVKARERAQFQS